MRPESDLVVTFNVDEFSELIVDDAEHGAILPDLTLLPIMITV